jgi:hypothetical protein
MTKNMQPRSLTAEEAANLLRTLELRFAEYRQRHLKLKWDTIEAKLLAQPVALWSLGRMDATGGEPDVVGYDRKSGEFLFVDCSPETPKERRSICYDRAAWESRKEHKPKTSAQEMATEMGIELLNETQYFQLQELGPFDQKTSSWLLTPPELRKMGGALFGDHRYGRTFIYHNGAESYYGVRGFRGVLRLS